MIIVNCEQGSEEWISARLGVISSSCFKDVLSCGRGSAPSKTREAYMYKLAAEKLTGLPQDNYTNPAMEWGKECEDQARAFYEISEGVSVEQVGFVMRDDGNVGSSPDGLVDGGLLEIKCPASTTQLRRYIEGVFPSEYKAQVQGQLWICEKQWCDFVSFDPRIKTDAGYFKIRVERDESFIKEIEVGVNHFLDELNELMEKLNGL